MGAINFPIWRWSARFVLRGAAYPQDESCAPGCRLLKEDGKLLSQILAGDIKRHARLFH
jgi:hypothetical protein